MGRPDVDTFREAEKMRLHVVLDNVRSLNNIGAIFRTCDAFAVREICLCGISSPPPSPEIHKTALGAEDSVAWRYFPTTTEAISALKAEGASVCALELTHNSVTLQDFIPVRGCDYALVVGNEVFGVDEKVLEHCDTCIEIPQRGTKHSLNVSVSTAVAIWHFFRILEL